MIIIDHLLRNPEEFEEVYDEYLDILIENFADDKVRKKQVEFKFYEDDRKIHKLTRPRFVTTLTMLLPLIAGGYDDEFKLDESLILDFENLDNSQMANLMDEKITPYYMGKVDPLELNEYYAFWRGRLKFSNYFTGMIGLNYSLKNEFDKFLVDEEYRDILTSRFDENLQPKEVSADLEDKVNRLIRSLMNDDNHPFKAILRCKEGLKKGQLQESHAGVGNKPDTYGNILPMPLNSNYLYHGIDSVPGYVVDANSGRKAGIMNDEYIGKGGYLSRMMQLNSQDTNLSDYEDSDCETHLDNLPRILIKNEDYLKRLIGRYYYDEDGEEEKVIDVKDKSLIGKYIRLRSPATCSSEDGDICHKCYGDLAYFNKYFHVGIVSASAIARPIFQGVMSAKHLLQANSIELVFNDDFYKFFELSGNMIYLKTDVEVLDENILKSLKLRIYKEDIGDENGDEEDLEENRCDEHDSINDHYVKYVNQFSVKDTSAGIKYKLSEEKDWNLYLTPPLIHLMKKASRSRKVENKDIPYIEIPFDKLDLSDVGEAVADDAVDSRFPIFYLEVTNIELTKPLHELKGILDVKKKSKELTSIDMALEKAFDLIVEAGIGSQFVAFEVVYRSLVRDNYNPYARPDFTQPNPEYHMVTIKHSLRNNPSPIVTLSFEDLKRRLISPDLYKRSEAGILDKFFHVIPKLD